MAGVGDLEKMQQEIGHRVRFLWVYVREAHAEDEWAMASNERRGISVLQPITDTERRSAASAAREELRLTIPVVVDGLGDTVSRAYGAWPDRLYVIGPDGRIAFQGGVGPFGFKPAEVRDFLRDRYGF